MTYREQFGSDFYEERYHDVVLKQRSMLGFWVVMSLGAMLVVFGAYLVYVNMIAPATSLPSLESSLHVIAAPVPASTFSLSALNNPPNFNRRDLAITVIPQSRAANALLGGQGPALLPSNGLATPSLLTTD